MAVAKKDDSGIALYFRQNSFTLCVCGVVIGPVV